MPSAIIASQLCSHSSAKGGTSEALQSSLPGLLPTPADPSCTGELPTVCSRGPAFLCLGALQTAVQDSPPREIPCQQWTLVHHHSSQVTPCHGNFPDRTGKTGEKKTKLLLWEQDFPHLTRYHRKNKIPCNPSNSI